MSSFLATKLRAADAVQQLEARLKTIEALVTNPHWEPRRKGLIYEATREAQHCLARIKRELAAVDDSDRAPKANLVLAAGQGSVWVAKFVTLDGYTEQTGHDTAQEALQVAMDVMQRGDGYKGVAVFRDNDVARVRADGFIEASPMKAIIVSTRRRDNRLGIIGKEGNMVEHLDIVHPAKTFSLSVARRVCDEMVDANDPELAWNDPAVIRLEEGG